MIMGVIEILRIGNNPKVDLIPLSNINIIELSYQDKEKKIKRIDISLNDGSGMHYNSENTECALYDKLP